ncbi:MAG TPA: nucleoside-diphosphate kinase, partial [Candidatus Marinimicrobia bacterium]|nr:nucleoside-diphosphate kinase [Candidatus Neomarinimicrobiota bacterium]
MTSGPSVLMVLERENAVEHFRKVIGATDPQKAAEGTLRRKYAENVRYNVIHGSDSDENAKKEIAFFFSTMEIIK